MNGKPSTRDVHAADLLAAWRQAERNTAAAREGRGIVPTVAEAEAAEAAAKAAYHAAQDQLFSHPDIATMRLVPSQAEPRRLV